MSEEARSLFKRDFVTLAYSLSVGGSRGGGKAARRSKEEQGKFVVSIAAVYLVDRYAFPVLTYSNFIKSFYNLMNFPLACSCRRLEGESGGKNTDEEDEKDI